jgi:hypothetical protein
VTVKLQLSSETEAKVRQQAAASGQDVESFILEAVAEKLADVDSQPSSPSRNGNDWVQKLRTCIDLHPVVTRFVDDSRESIYAGRGG